MCIAELNVSLLPCRHRWYHLTRSCSPSTNLANCGSKLGISGWEIKCDFCPFCAGWNLSTSEYRLLGNDRSPSIGGLSRTPSLSMSATRRDSRRASIARSDSNTSITLMASEKNRAMNSRVDAYFRIPPETTVLTEARDAEDQAEAVVTNSPSDTSSEGHESIRQPSVQMHEKTSLMKKVRRKSKRLSLSLFK